MSKKVVLIQFSSRNTGNCAAISNYIAVYYAGADISNYTVDDSVVQACNHCDYECLQPGKDCPNLNKTQKQIMDTLCGADLAYFIVPNYCGYPSANYFVFNERSVGYFNMDRELLQKYMAVPKRFIVVSNTEGQNFVGALKQQVSGEQDILYIKTSKYKKRSIAGDVLESDEAKADLKAFLDRGLA